MFIETTLEARMNELEKELNFVQGQTRLGKKTIEKTVNKIQEKIKGKYEMYNLIIKQQVKKVLSSLCI